MTRALITGITGQDGAYLAHLLLSKGYKVFGLKRRLSTENLWRLDYLGVTKDITLIDGDMTDFHSLKKAVDISEPDEIYNLAAQSFVRSSFDTPASTFDVNAKGVIHLLELVKSVGCKFYQASTSEMFGKTEGVQNEETPFNPQSPYAVAKLAAHYSVRNYRDAYGINASCGILFNHESPLRGEEFVTQKVAKAVKRIKAGDQTPLYMGNLEAQRDWGHAKDYVRAMWMMLQKDPDDYVIATGEAHSIYNLLSIAFAMEGMDFRHWIKIDEKHLRPLEVPYLKGDPSKAKEKLGWEPEVKFHELIQEMVTGKLRLAA